MHIDTEKGRETYFVAPSVVGVSVSVDFFSFDIRKHNVRKKHIDYKKRWIFFFLNQTCNKHCACVCFFFYSHLYVAW